MPNWHIDTLRNAAPPAEDGSHSNAAQGCAGAFA
jgi:hypothetical protein